MPTLMEFFLGINEPLLPVYVPPSPPKVKTAGIMEAARLPVDRFLIFAEEGDSTGPTGITIKR